MITHRTPVRFLGIVLLFLGLWACKPEPPLPPATDTPGDDDMGTFMFHMHSFIDDEEVFLYDIPQPTLDGRTMSLSLAQLFVSEIELIRNDNSSYPIPGRKFLKVLELDSYLGGRVPVGTYKTIRFKVGLDPATNGMAPSASPDSIMLKRSEMWFGASAQPDGYVFLNVQGAIDTTADMSGALVPFSYRIGTNANYTQVTLPDKAFTIAKDQVFYAHTLVDYYKVFQGIDLSVPGNLTIDSPADNSSDLAQRIARNIPAMFRYEL